MERMTKEELRTWATCFANVISTGRDGDITFSVDGHSTMTCAELCDRIRPLDPLLADRVAAWHSAATDLGHYVANRLDTHRAGTVMTTADRSEFWASRDGKRGR